MDLTKFRVDFALMECGEQFVMTCGVYKMLKLCARQLGYSNSGEFVEIMHMAIVIESMYYTICTIH